MHFPMKSGLRPPLRTGQGFGPPLTKEESTISLTVLERNLNSQMKCPAGRNQVYLRSLVTGRGALPPRVTLKCRLRKEIGQPQDVYYEHIRDVCCGDPDSCEAWTKLKTRFVPT